MKLHRNQAGAAMVFGIFFALLLVASVYTLFGTVETVLYRQHVQDAADAAAFSAAVVNARGMNLIALINMTMAVVLSILVALRLAETLGYISIGVCLALSAVTFGATASAVPPLQTATKAIAKAAEKVKDPIENILKVLHTLSKVTATVVPVGANARVIDLVASHYDAFGLAVPARLTLPVEDDDFGVLCEHAGRIAGELAILPISPILPKKVEEKLGDVAGKVARAGSSWFCGKGGTPPNLNSDEDSRWVELPRFDSQDLCDQKARSRVNTEEDDQTTEDACNRANYQQLSSVPDRLGRCRDGQDICPTRCSGPSAPETCPPAEFESCTPERAKDVAGYASSALQPSLVSCGPGSPYDERRTMARDQCQPAPPGRSDLSGHMWLQRDVTREFRWDKVARQWLEDEAERIEEPIVQKRLKDGDRRHPCGQDGLVGNDYQRDTKQPLCESVARCQTGTVPGLLPEAPCSRAAPQPQQPQHFTERSTQVTDVLRCVYRVKNPQIATPRMDLSKDLDGTKTESKTPSGASGAGTTQAGNTKTGKDGEGTGRSGEDESNTNPFRLEKGVMLGQSDFQLRAVVVAKSVPTLGQQMVALAWWGGPRGADIQREGGVVASAMTRLGRVGMAQAEYYFDWTGLGAGAPNNQNKPDDKTEWMWNMGWRARLRPFRLLHGDADPAQPDDTKKATSKPELDFGKLPDNLRGGATEALGMFGGGAS